MRIKATTLLAMLLMAFSVFANTGIYNSLAEANENPAAVVELKLNAQGLSSLPPDFSKFVNLQKLDLSDNNFTTIPSVIFNCKKLRVLLLTANRINNISPSISLLTELEELDLGYNMVSELPNDMAGLKKITRLVLSRNQLKSLPSGLNALTKVEILDISNNLFTSIPSCVASIKSIKALDCSYNKYLGAYPANINNLTEMKIFNLKGTKISEKQVESLMYLVPDCKLFL